MPDCDFFCTTFLSNPNLKFDIATKKVFYSQVRNQKTNDFNIHMSSAAQRIGEWVSDWEDSQSLGQKANETGLMREKEKQKSMNEKHKNEVE